MKVLIKNMINLKMKKWMKKN